MRRRLSKADLTEIFHASAEDILNQEKVLSMDTYIQHGNTSCLRHSVAVAYFGLAAVNFLKIKCDKASLVRGALLHDYFLYDWHEGDGTHNFHGFTHPGAALKNASRDFILNDIERDIIAKHMFPLVPVPPRHIESLVICITDKLCSIYEVFSLNSYRKVSKRLFAPA